MQQMEDREGEIAVVGMSCRFPGARDTAEFWRNLAAGVESVSFFSDAELRQAGASDALLAHPGFVGAHGALADAFAFDAPFFGVSHREAQVIDPQHRVFLECAWSALEDAGVDPARFAGAIGVYAGSGFSSHAALVAADEELAGIIPPELLVHANDKDFLTTRVSYKLGLRGPSMAVQTACSTSLVAIHVACQSLLNRECDVALAGGATIWPEQVSGYVHQEGGIRSPDGHCRAFDARAAGTIAGSGAGVVALKRMVDALRDGDTIHAVVKGTAINNDGAGKIGFTAPSVQGQARAVAEAIEIAGLEPADVSYVEAHGTGTPLGDPIEIAALREVFGPAEERAAPCAIGAVKSNFGHLDTAAGVAGFIKTVLALKHRMLPPTLHFQSANPETGLDDSPFVVNAALRPWDGGGAPLRAGVSSFGIGGTNAHVVLEEAPAVARTKDADAAKLVVLSAKTEAALDRMRANLAAHLEQDADVSLADVAWTLQEGRAAHRHRFATVARSVDAVREALAAPSRKPRRAADPAPPVAFLFPGQGTQYAGMARALYEGEPVFRREIDRCCDVLVPELGMDLRAALFPADGGEEEANALLQQTRLTQPALFAIEYATAQLWMSRGVKPEAMLGHSIGEYVAACIAGVFSLDAALHLVAARGRLMQGLPGGSMLAVPLPEEEVRALLPATLSLAAVNSAAHCVVAGDTAEIEALEAALNAREVSARRLHTSHAFHSAAMDPVLAAFAEEVRRARPAAPSLPFLSNVTGTWITAEQATDAGYWARHLRGTVRFADGVGHLLEDPDRVLLEVGPGETLGTFARRHPRGAGRTIVKSLAKAGDPQPADVAALEAAAALWTAGVALDWAAIRGSQPGRRIHLPTYPFERTVHRVNPRRAASEPVTESAPGAQAPDAHTVVVLHPEREQPYVATELTQAPDRLSRIADSVTELFARLVGVEPAELEPGASFLELGADSLLLMQLSRTLEKTFGMRVPFRHLLEELATVEGLAAHLDGKLAPDFALPGQPAPAPAAAEPMTAVAVMEAPVVTAVAVAPQPVAVAAAPAPMPQVHYAPAGDGSPLQGLFAQQLSIMQRQLELLGAAPAAPVHAPVSNGHASNGHGSNGATTLAATNGNGSNGAQASNGNGGKGALTPASRLERVQAAIAAPDTQARPAATTGAAHGPHRPVAATKNLGGGFNERQAAHFDALVQRYTARTRGSREYAAHNRPWLSDNRASYNFRQATKELLYPIVGDRSQGARVWDVDGNEYVDFTIGFGVHFFGHRPQFVIDAVEKQLRRGYHTGPQSDMAGPTAALMREISGMERVTFCNTGSEAVMTALRVARTVTRRDKVVTFEASYHGCFDGILGRNGATPGTIPIVPGTPQGMVEDLVLLPYGTPEALEYLRAHAGEIAAVLVEPIQSNNPELQPGEFLRELRAYADESGTALIFDEMITGLRLGHRGAQGWFGVEADMATYGKVIGGGFPLGVLAGKPEFMDAIDGGAWNFGDASYPEADQTFFAGTFCKHPVVMAAAHAVLLHLKEQGQGLYDRLHARAARLVAALRRVIEEEGAPIRIVHAHSYFRFAFRPEDRFIDLLFYHMLERGIYIWEGRGCFLSTAHTDEDCDFMVQALRESLHALRDGGFLPEKPGGGGSSISVPSDLKIFTAPQSTSSAEAKSFPLTPAQRQVWVHSQLGDDASRAYNEQFVVSLRGRMDENALRAAVADVVAHHESLRTVFDPSGDAQHVRAALTGPMPIVIDAPGEVEDVDRLRAAMRETMDRVFDLANGPLFRVRVHAHGADRQVLQFVIHHAAADGLAIDLLERDLETAYAARREGRAPTLPPAMQFSEYARLFAEHAETHADAEAEWLASFQGAAPLALPYDRPRAEVPSHTAGTAAVTIPAEVTARLKELCKRQGCTPFMTLMTGLLATLHRVTGQHDLVAGISSAGRPFTGADSLVGHCVDVLPIRSRVEETTGALRFLKDVRGWMLDAMENEVFSYARLSERLQIPRGPSIPPLISVLFNLEPGVHGTGGGGTRTWGGHEVAAGVGAPAAFTKFDLGFDAVDFGDEFYVACMYNRDLFDAATVETLLARFARVLEQLPAAAELRVGDLELMGAAERAQVVSGWNATAADFPAGRCIHQLFEEQAERTPDAVALTAEGESLTYRALNERANRLAHHLRGRGVGPEVSVGVMMERGTEMVVALLGILKAGGAYVPLDAEYPAERLAYMLEDSGVPLVLTQKALRASLKASAGVEVLDVEAKATAKKIAAESSENPAGVATPKSLAYVIYTSGSTGKPKGVMNAHRGVVNRLAWMQAEFALTADDVVLQKTPFGFDVSVWEFFWPLQQGARLVMARAGGHREPEYLQQVIAKEGVTTLHFVPSMLQTFVESVDPARCASLKRVVCSGEALPAALVRRFHERFPAPVSIHNLYGPTEAAVDVSCWSCARGEEGDVIPIGRPVWNTALYVLDSAGRPLPAGVAGELYIGGVQVARGYLGRPALTAEKFVPDPFSPAPGARLYRTGDLARWRADGAIEYLGRLDHQVKLRGFRIELGEIESALRECPGVTDCVVVARDDEAGDRQLVAYTVGAADFDTLRAALGRTLPEYMVPAAFVGMDALPLSPNGKLDRKALPAPETTSAERAFVAPRNPVEEVLAGIFAEVLGMERVGAADGFFELGGHSLKATRVVSKVRAVFGVEVSLRTLFEAPTVARLAERVETIRRQQLGLLPPVVAVERTGTLAPSFAQERLWFLDRLQPGSPVYNLPVALRLGGALDAAALERALGELVRRHEVLRTVFAEHDDLPVQVIRPFAGFALPVEDAACADEDRVSELVAEEARRPFDLAEGPLFRARLLRIGAEDHVLLLTLHHVVADGWSMAVLYGELDALYAAFRDGRTSALPDLPVQYADFAAWQREHLAGEVLERQLAYWKRALAGAPALLELPTDHVRPAVPTNRGAFEVATFGGGVLERLTGLAQAEGATLYMALLAVFQVLLSKYSGSTDVVVGTPISGRTTGEIEGLIGFFVNTLVMRTDLGGDPTFREVLGRVRDGALGAYEHQDVPFEKLVETLAPERSLSHSPLFQVMFTMDDAAATAGGGGLGGLRSVDVSRDTGAVKFDLNLRVGARGTDLWAGLGYSTELFEPATAARMMGHLGRLLEQVAADPGVRFSELELLGEAERALVVDEWNATDAEYPRDLCTHQLFEAQAERTPHAVAVNSEDETLTYAELNARANRLAHHLVAIGVGPDVPVGLCMERGTEMAVGLLAVLKAGGAYVPLDPDYPADRLRHMVEDSAPAALLVHGAPDALVAGLAGERGIPVIRMETDADDWADLPATNPARTDLRPEHLVYIIYTSGSTGRPKGVMNHHGCLVNRLVWGARGFDLTADDVLLCKTSLSFDGHVRETFLPWSVGARVAMARPGGHKDPDYLLDVIRAEGVTTVNMNASMLLVLLENPRLERCAGLRQLFSGGEALPGAALLRFRERLPGTVLHNLYGPSEAATALVALHCGPEQARAVVPIGKPIANTRAYLLDPAGNPVPVGVVGEVYMGGHGVCRGYLGRAAQTAERFVPDPFGGEPGARLYRTGDLGRRLADGAVEFLGRNDFQVKVRGFRIELGEVEARVAEHPGVREAAVMARRDATGENRLVAWYTGAESVDPAALRAYLAERLPDYMVPSAYVRMERFPLTPSAKLDRNALPDPEGGAYVTRMYEAPQGALEEAVAGIWADVLGAEQVGRNDHFFELGGHSLRAVQVISRVRHLLGMEAALGEIFQRPVLADFAAGLGGAAGSGLPAIVPAPRDGRMELSFAQQRLWFVERMGSSEGAYHIPARLRLRGTLDRDALGRALDRILERHEALRTTFVEDAAGPMQRILPVEESCFLLLEHDLEDVPGADVELARLVDAEAVAPFDLERGPVIRGRLIRMAADDHVLLLTMHHIASDGWSTGILLNELSVLYRAYLAGEGDPLPPLPVQYADYAAWQRRWLEGEVLQRQADYWKGALSGAPEMLELPTDRPRPAQQDLTGAVVMVSLDEALTDGLKALSRRHGTTLFVTLMAAWAATLARLSGQTEVVVGTPSANRGRREIEGLVGFFINTLAIRVDLSGAPSVGQLISRVAARALDAQQHEDLPFERVVELVQPARSLSYSPLFQAVFAWQNTPGGALDLPGLEVGGVEADPYVPAKYDLSLGLQELNGQIRGGLWYATSIFDQATIERWLGYLRIVLVEMVADDARRMDALPFLPADERRMVVDGWNQTEREYPQDICLHRLFAKHVAERPDAAALEWDDLRLTYAQLDARANRLANHLAGLGVGAESRVGVLLERGAEMVISVLAITKAGGCYVPLDPAYPAERLRLMLDDAGVRVLLTRRDLADTVAAEAGDDLRIVFLDEAADAIAAESDAAPESGVSEQNLAYIVYTSGSSGRPKGVMVNHRTVVQLVVGTDYVTFGPGDRIAQASNASFDAMAFEIWGAFLNGATLVGIGRDVLLSSPAMRAFLRDERITTLYQTTALLNQLSREQPDIFQPLREVLFGGQAADADAVRRILKGGPPKRLLHMYGPTETTAWCSCEEVKDVAEDALTVCVGRPTGNQRIYLLDRALRPVAVGVTGEAYVGGGGVVRGYLDRPGLTAERFVPDPFTAEPGARMYRTGDRLRRNADGSLEFVGRVDEQVKIRGFRIEPGEVESALSAHPWADEVRVIAREDQPGEHRLVAYVVGEVNAHELREFLEGTLPEYMIPAAFVVMDRLPLTPGGKLDKRALPAPEYAGMEALYVAPRTVVEEALAELWMNVLRVDRVGVNDDFFDLGGHSLLIMRLIAQVRDAFGLEMSIRDVFAAPTLEALAAELERRIYEDIAMMPDADAEQLAALTQTAGD
jgi:amino acid adenylation domain-containing protein